jgi:p-hydroxybenzoate 3-monooxygenase
LVVPAQAGPHIPESWNKTDFLDVYSKTCLDRVWKAQRFSWWMTQIFQLFPDLVPFDRRLLAELDISPLDSGADLARPAYTGLPIA